MTKKKAFFNDPFWGVISPEMQIEMERRENVLRIRSLVHELRIAAKILDNGVTNLKMVEEDDDPVAWSNGSEITLNASKLPDAIDLPLELAVWIGAAFHELGHTLFTPRQGSKLNRRIEKELSFFPGMFHIFNIAEDPRVERALIGRFNTMRGYLTAVVMEIIANENNKHIKTAWPLVCGRTWLAQDIRSEIRKYWVERFGEDSAVEVAEIIGEYQDVKDPADADSDQAWSLLRRLWQEIYGKDSEDLELVCGGHSMPIDGESIPIPENGGCKFPMPNAKDADDDVAKDDGIEDWDEKSKENPSKDTNGGGKGSARCRHCGRMIYRRFSSDGDEYWVDRIDNDTACGDTPVKLFATNGGPGYHEPEDSEEGSDSDGDGGDGEPGESDEDFEGDPDGDGECDCDGCEAARKALEEESGGASGDDGESEEESDGDEPSDGTGHGETDDRLAKIVAREEREDKVFSAVRRSVEDILKQADVVRDLDMYRKAVDRATRGTKVTRNGWHPTVYDPDEYQIYRRNQVRDAFSDLRVKAQGGWNRNTKSGKFRFKRAMKPAANPNRMYDRFQPAMFHSQDLEFVILVDRSSSMNGWTHELSEAVWFMHHACDAVDVPLTIYAFDDGEPANLVDHDSIVSEQIRLVNVDGNTNPQVALEQAYDVLMESHAMRKYMLIMTDGSWYGENEAESVIAMMNRDGIHTVGMFFDDDIREAEEDIDASDYDSHGVQTFIVTNTLDAMVTLIEGMIEDTILEAMRGGGL